MEKIDTLVLVHVLNSIVLKNCQRRWCSGLSEMLLLGCQQPHISNSWKHGHYLLSTITKQYREKTQAVTQHLCSLAWESENLGRIHSHTTGLLGNGGRIILPLHASVSFISTKQDNTTYFFGKLHCDPMRKSLYLAPEASHTHNNYSIIILV